MQSKRGASYSQLVVVSNRGPFEHHLGPGNQVETGRSSGGLVTALSAFRQYYDFSWIASAITPGDRFVAHNRADLNRHFFSRGAHPSELQSSTRDACSPDVEFVLVPKDVFHNHYDVFGNRVLWFLQHSMWDQLQAPKDKDTIGEAWWSGYLPANRAFAQAVVAKVGGQKMPVIMLHDYHLYLAPGFIRQQFPNAVLQHFVHIPWPAPALWQPLPQSLRSEVCRSLLANDIAGFQTSASARDFLRCCDQFLEGADVDHTGRTVRFHNRTTRVRAYPISVDTNELRDAMKSPVVRRHQERLRSLCGEKTIVRVDRLGPSKNIVRGFRAFEQLLHSHQELQGRVKFLAFLVPSRVDIQEYARYRDEVTSLVQEINTKFGGDGFRPIEVFCENNYYQALAGMSLCDVLLVNPVADGMNLVAKEGPVVSARDSVLVLSNTAGAFEQLRGGAIGVEPADVDGTARALADALRMSQEERRERILSLRAKIEKEDIAGWITAQMDDIDSIIAERSGQTDSQQSIDFRRERTGVQTRQTSVACRVPSSEQRGTKGGC